MLKGKERSILRGYANGLRAVVQIGKAGLTDNIVKTVDEYLDANELIKVSIGEGVELDPKVVCNELAEKLGAEYVQAIGRRFVLYRQAKDPAKRRIEL